MRLLVAAITLTAVLLASPRAHAENWVTVTSGADRSQYEVDTSSVKASGGFYTDWIRETLAGAHWDRAGNGWYRTMIMQRLENCRDGTAAIIATISMDSKGRTLSSESVPQSRWVFLASPPGSVSQVIQNQVCALAMSRATLKPALKAGPTTGGDWRAFSYDPVLKIDYAFDPKSVGQLKDGDIVVVERQTGRGPMKLGNGIEYATGYLLMLVDCSASTFGVAAADDYDSAGNLVWTETMSQDRFKADPIRPGTIADALKQAACATDQVPPPRGGGPEAGGQQTVSGTGWLGPKGYLVTAAHVIKGATAITSRRTARWSERRKSTSPIPPTTSRS